MLQQKIIASIKLWQVPAFSFTATCSFQMPSKFSWASKVSNTHACSMHSFLSKNPNRGTHTDLLIITTISIFVTCLLNSDLITCSTSSWALHIWISEFLCHRWTVFVVRDACFLLVGPISGRCSPLVKS